MTGGGHDDPRRVYPYLDRNADKIYSASLLANGAYPLSPSRVPLLADSYRPDGKKQIVNFCNFVSAGSPRNSYIHLRHAVTANIAFFDGHAATMRAQDFRYIPDILNNYLYIGE